jgi:hypothetical protein
VHERDVREQGAAGAPAEMIEQIASVRKNVPTNSQM